MITLSKRGFNAVKDKGCFAVSFSLQILFSKKLPIDDAVFAFFGKKEGDDVWLKEKREYLVNYHKENLSDLFYFNGDYFEAKDPKFFSEDQKKRGDVPYEEILKLYNMLAPDSVPKVRVDDWDITMTRHRDLCSRWEWFKKEYKGASDQEVLCHVAEFFRYVFKSDFMCNKKKEGAKFNLMWYFNKTNFFKIISGQYHNDGKPFIEEE